MKKNTVQLLIVLLLITLPANLVAIPENFNIGSPYISVYTPKDYGADTQNRGFEQDRRGIIYIANNHGVMIHDSDTWIKVPVNNRTVVRSLALDQNDRLYIGAVNEFGYLDYNATTGEPLYKSLTESLSDNELDFGDVNNIFITNYGTYFCTENKTIIYHNGELEISDFRFAYYTEVLINGKTIVFEKNNGLVQVNDNKIVPLQGTENILDILGKSAFIIPYSENVLLLGGENNKLYLYNMDVHTLEPFYTEADEYMQHNSLANGIILEKNRFAFTTFEGGIFIIDGQGRLEQIINSSRGLPDKQMDKGLMVDRDGNLWTCNQTGISLIELGTNLTKFDKTNGINDTVLIFEELDGVIYAGTFGGIYCLPEYTLSLENDRNTFQEIHTLRNGVWDMLKMNDYIISGGFSNLIAVKNRQAYEIPIIDENGSSENDLGLIMNLGVSSAYKNNLFIGTQEKGFIILEAEEVNDKGVPAAMKIVKRLEEFNNHMIFEILEDGADGFWVNVYSKGLWHIKFSDFKNFEYTIDKYSPEDGLPSKNWNIPNYIDGEIIITTTEGIYEIAKDENGSIFFQEHEAIVKAIGKNDTMHIEKDPAGRYWATGEYGLTYFTKNEDGSYQSAKNNIRRLDDSLTSYFVDSNNIVWLGCAQSIQRYDVNKAGNIDTPYRTLIKKVVNNRKDTIFYGNNPAVDTENSPIPNFEYEKNSFIFEYAAIWYIKPEKISYSFKLQGYDQNWSTWSDETKKEYTNLSDGTYSFMVKAKNLYRNESEISEYKFIIHPPWYKTIYAFAGYLMILGLLFFFGIRINNRRLIAKNQALERIVKKRTSELEKLTIVASETDNGVIIFDGHGTIEWINEAFSRIHYITLKDIADSGKTTIFDVSGSTDSDLKKLLKSCIAEKKSIKYQSTFMKKGGEPGITQTLVTPVFYKNGTLNKLVAIESDITELTLAQREAIANAHKAGMADVAINTIHSVGNILNSLRASTETIQEITKNPIHTKFGKANDLLRDNLSNLENFISTDPKGQKLIEYYFKLEDSFSDEHNDIQDKIGSISNKIDAISNVLATHHNYIGDNISMIESYNIKNVIEDAISINSRFIDNNEIKVEKQFENVPMVKLHKSKVMQAIMNVITNAGEAMADIDRKNRKLTFTLEQPTDDSVILKISDTGCGFIPENNQLIFAHGYTTKEAGRGFGLHNAANYLTEMDGKMWAESEGLSKGATICMCFRAD